jgi:hypothetical protein
VDPWVQVIFSISLIFLTPIASPATRAVPAIRANENMVIIIIIIIIIVIIMRYWGLNSGLYLEPLQQSFSVMGF